MMHPLSLTRLSTRLNQNLEMMSRAKLLPVLFVFGLTTTLASGYEFFDRPYATELAQLVSRGQAASERTASLVYRVAAGTTDPVGSSETIAESDPEQLPKNTLADENSDLNELGFVLEDRGGDETSNPSPAPEATPSPSTGGSPSPTPTPSPSPTPTTTPSATPTPAPTPSPSPAASPTPSPSPSASPSPSPVSASETKQFTLSSPGSFTPAARGTATIEALKHTSGYWDFVTSVQLSGLEPNRNYRVWICNANCSSPQSAQIQSSSEGNAAFSNVVFTHAQWNDPVSSIRVWEELEPGPVPSDPTACFMLSNSSTPCLQASIGW